jgi:hypothetical protein
MTTCFITYVPKPTKTKDNSKLLFKNILKEFGTSNNNQLLIQNLLSVKVSAIESDFLIQKANRNNRITIQSILVYYIYCTKY